MSRLLFAAGARGPLVAELQSALTGKGFDTRGVDGLFGNDTEAAVRMFQASAGAIATGAVSDGDWTAITGGDVPDIEARCLQLTSAFEGHGYTLAQGNWDGAWLTWGIIGFTLKHGEIQTIIRNVQRSAPNRIREAFGPDADELLDVIDQSAADQEAWANRLSAGSRVVEPWRTGFAVFGGFPEVQAEQQARAHDDYFVPSALSAGLLGLRSELGLALCFDIQVQNGGVSSALRRRLTSGGPFQSEAAARTALANAVADAAKVRFRDDVRSRKMAIAVGRGVVHGREVVLANWGLAEV